MTDYQKPVGILGGTFDPIHHGHLRLAIECYERLDLGEVRFIPLNSPPHRNKPFASPEQRLAMLKLAIKNIHGLVIDEWELQRQEISYTIDTVKFAREKSGNTPICLLVGTDAFNTLHTWHDWKSLLDYVHIVIAERRGNQDRQQIPELIQLLANHKTDHADILKKEPAGKIFEIEIPLLDISATQIREILKIKGNPEFLLPGEVIRYIHNNNIYQTG